MVTLDDVRRWDASGVEDAFTLFGTARHRLLDVEFDLGAARPPVGWIGRAAELAHAEHDVLAKRLRLIVDGMAAVRPTLATVTDAAPTDSSQGTASP